MMSQNQISVGYHVQNPQNRTITIKFDPCYINVTSKMEDNKYHNNAIIAATLWNYAHSGIDMSKYKR
jgi:uncharacterized lipoprotein YajG